MLEQNRIPREAEGWTQSPPISSPIKLNAPIDLIRERESRPKWGKTEEQHGTFNEAQDEEAAEVRQELEEAQEGGPEPSRRLHWRQLPRPP